MEEKTMVTVEEHAVEYLQRMAHGIKELYEIGFDESTIKDASMRFFACRDMVEYLFNTKISIKQWKVIVEEGGAK